MNSKITDIYLKMLSGDQHVVNEAKVTIEYEGGKTDQVEISDENARELREIAKVSTSRNPMIMKIDGKWVGSDRLNKKQLEDTYAEVRDMSDMGSVNKEIVQIATTATIFDRSVSSFEKTLKDIRTFLIDSAKLTLEKKNEKANPRSIKRELIRILGIIKSGVLQKAFVERLNSDTGGTFNIWEVSESKAKNNKIYFDLDSEVGRALQVMRPASDLAATRGAAGPGEALLAFLYGGTKPDGAGDILLSSGANDSIELKKTTGRIGKYITKKSVKELDQLFYGKSPSVELRNAHLADERRAPGGTIYKDIKVPFPESIAEYLGLKDKNQTVFSVDQLSAFEARLEDPKGLAPEALEEWKNSKHPYYIFNQKKWKVSIPHPPASTAAGKPRSTSSSVFADMSVRKFLDKYSGVTTGEKNVEFNTELPGGYVSEVMDTIPGNSPRQKIANLVGVWHLKHYLSHISPFKWLLVYTPDGTAAAVTYDTIINQPTLELIKIMTKKHLLFGIRPDDQGFHIEVHKENTNNYI